MVSPLKAIRDHCIECSGGSRSEADRCHLTKCPLHAFRKGKNPYRTKRVLTEEQRQATTLRLAEARKKSSNLQRENDQGI